MIEYDGETHSAANLFDALKEGYYGKFQANLYLQKLIFTEAGLNFNEKNR